MVQVAYTAVEAAPGRPRRAVTVRDAIGDLPPISNGADVEEMPFSGAPTSSRLHLLLRTLGSALGCSTFYRRTTGPGRCALVTCCGQAWEREASR